MSSRGNVSTAEGKTRDILAALLFCVARILSLASSLSCLRQASANFPVTLKSHFLATPCFSWLQWGLIIPWPGVRIPPGLLSFLKRQFEECGLIPGIENGPGLL